MSLSSDLISQFVKVTNDNTETQTETTVFGTIVSYDGSKYVQLDGSDLLTPISTTTNAQAGDRVTVLIKNHTATVTGNITSPSATVSDVAYIEEAAEIVAEFETVLADKVNTDDLSAQTARIDSLEAIDVTITETLAAAEANIDNLQASTVTITESLTAANAAIKDLQANSITADSIEGKYANIDFSNIGEAAMEYLYSTSGLIENVVIGNSTITGTLVGVTINGDLIEVNTLVADKLVIKGEDGLYYKLNTDGMSVEAEQTDYNSLDGSIIKAKSITATKISVDDLVAFDATIGGFNITDSSLYSGVKSSVNNTTRGVYLDNDGQAVFGDASNFVKYYKDTDGTYKLVISADSITFGSENTSVEDAAKTATNYLNFSDDGLVVGDITDGTLYGNVLLTAETDGASISLRDGLDDMVVFSARTQKFSGITSAVTSVSSTTQSEESESGSSSETIVSASQLITSNETLSVVKFDTDEPIYFSGGVRTNGVTITDDNLIANADMTLDGRIFDVNGRSSFEPVTGAGNLSIGYGRYKAATSSSTDWSILYGNKVKIATKNGASVVQDGSVALETENSNGNMVLGYHLYKKGTGSTNIYGGKGINLIADEVSITDETGNTCFQSLNENGNTVIGYARYANGGSTNIYGGSELNLIATSGGNITTHNSLYPSLTATYALGKAGELGWSNIYIGNASGAYNGLRIILDGENQNICGRNEDGRFIFGNAGSVMYYRAKDVDSSNTGDAFRFTSGNEDGSYNSSSTWLFGRADSTSRFMGSYLAYNRTYSSSANMYVTANGIFGRSTSSSERYKNDISVADITELKGLYDLPVKKFKYNDGYIATDDELYGKHLYGFIVEDLEDILPCAVQHKENENGELIPEMWNSNIIVPSLLKLIQDLNNRIKILEEALT